RAAVIAVLPEDVARGRKNRFAIEGRRAAALSLSAISCVVIIFHNGHSRNISRSGLFRNGHCDYRRFDPMSLPLEPQDAQQTVGFANALDAVIDRTIAAKRLVGAVVLIAQDGDIV